MVCSISFITITPPSFAEHGDRNEVEEFTIPTCENTLETFSKPENETQKNSSQDQSHDNITANRDDLINTVENDVNVEGSGPAPEHDQVFPEPDLPDRVDNPEQVYFLEVLEPELVIKQAGVDDDSVYSDFDAVEADQVFTKQDNNSGFIAFEQINSKEPDLQELIHDDAFTEETFADEAPPTIHLTEVRTIFEINKADDFQLARDNPGAFFVVTGNVSIENTESWVPIGAATSPFSGNFDGQGFTISGLFASSNQNYLGLFGYTNGATLENINLEAVDLDGGEYVGGLVGLANNTTISNCSVSGVVSGKLDSVGGLVGKADKSTITDSSGNVVVSGEKGKVGGLVGFAYKSHIVNSAANGRVTGQGNIIGGLIGQVQSSTITTSYADSTVTGSDTSSGVGGLAGMLTQNSGIYNSYATGVVSGGTNVGGLVGLATSGDVIINSYGSVKVSRSSDEDKICRLIGHHYSGTTISSSYWDMKDCENDATAGAEARTTEEMKRQENYVGWDFINTWFIEEGLSFPLLQWQLVAPEPVVPDEPPALPPADDHLPTPPEKPDNPDMPSSPSFFNPKNMLPGLVLNHSKRLPGYNKPSISLRPQQSSAYFNSRSTLNLANRIYYYLEQAEEIIKAFENGELAATDQVLSDLDSYYYWAELYFIIYQQRYGLFEVINIEERLALIRLAIEKYQAH
jgi:hypothetical protein